MAVKNYFLFFILLVAISCGQAGTENNSARPDQTSMPPAPPPPPPRAGDIIFQVSASGQGKAIQIATGSKYSHCGILVTSEELKYLYVLEAVQPVKLTPLEKWINRGDGDHYVIKRLKDQSLLSAAKRQEFLIQGKKYIGRDYDLYFGWGDDRIYCSELVWKLYKEVLGIEIGKLQKLKEFDLSHPIVQKKLKERYGNNIPYDEQVISPAAIFDSPLLQTIMEK